MKIKIENITKTYGKKISLNNISFELEENKIYGLLGRNGAGKTTLMHLIAGHISPSDGSVKLNGLNPFNNRNVLKNICLINESGNFNQSLKIKDVLKISSLFYPNWNKEIAENLLIEFNLDRNLRIKSLSKGMESALGILIGLACRSAVTIFDEPYIGLDAALRARFYELLLEEYENEPRTFILSTHLIDEVSNLFEEVIILQEGKLVLQEQAEVLIEKSISVTGKKDIVQDFCKGKNVLHVKEFVGQQTAVLYGESFHQSDLYNQDLTVESVHIQDLMVYLTSSSKGSVSI
ncbi:MULTISPECIES: ATP-binding cassette domain-containing protein [Metabacillus]|uniref:ABC transporter ATP-binding protein n=2 Tax=Metabacillus TaxID=2675233 RepID=A0A179T118_9BACI|nr:MULTISPECIES: ABC transporter ATP-binding protein [Metabacillus]OAS86759.1 ABC transporter ATP-binding protein [Metabacillus litoralis]QNF29169.1 ABC transporter ATP-binding protein [Metabacillus sp. KUDC1714]